MSHALRHSLGLSAKRVVASLGVTGHPMHPVLAQRLAERPEQALQIGLEYVAAHRMLNTSNFFFVQIGASDGRNSDPIHDLVVQHRWRGVLVEPLPHIFGELQTTYRDMPELSLRNVAIADQNGQRAIYTVKDLTGLPDFATGIASFYRGIVEANFPGHQVAETIVPCVTMNALLEEAGCESIDLLQIDAEGYDAEIIRLLDLERWEPAIINFEHRHLSRDTYAGIVDMLLARGYQLTVGGIDLADTLAYKPRSRDA